MLNRLTTDSRGRQNGLLAILLGIAAAMLVLSVHLLVSGWSSSSHADFGWVAYGQGSHIYDAYTEQTPEGLRVVSSGGVRGYGYGTGAIGATTGPVWAFGTGLVLIWLFLRVRANRAVDRWVVALALLLWSVSWPGGLLSPWGSSSGLLPMWLVVLLAVPLAMSVARRDAVAETRAPAGGGDRPSGGGGADETGENRDGNGGTAG